jgi:hypothetical protein
VTTTAELWASKDPDVWRAALANYWSAVQCPNMEIEEALNDTKALLDRVRQMTPEGWYKFLRYEYFRWKYTQRNWYKTTSDELSKYEGKLGDLDKIRLALLRIDPHEIKFGLKKAGEIRGLGMPGASGLLALLYPRHFGTVDLFVVERLSEVPDLPDAAAIARMQERALKAKARKQSPPAPGVRDSALLIDIMQRKAAELNTVFGDDFWTPRKIDMVLWGFGRPACRRARSGARPWRWPRPRSPHCRAGGWP